MENRMNKRTFVAISVLFLILLVINGCWNKNPLTGAAVAVNEPIKIGALLPLTGDAAAYGENAKKGIELAIEGTNLVVIYENGRCNAQDSAEGMKKLVAQEVKAVVGELCGDATTAAYEIAKESGIVMINPVSKDISLNDIGEYDSKEYNKESLIGRQFVNRYRIEYNEDPGIFAAESYDAVLALNEAFSKSDGSNEGVKNVLKDLKFNGASGLIDFDGNGDVNKPYNVLKVVNREFVDSE